MCGCMNGGEGEVGVGVWGSSPCHQFRQQVAAIFVTPLEVAEGRALARAGEHEQPYVNMVNPEDPARDRAHTRT